MQHVHQSNTSLTAGNNNLEIKKSTKWHTCWRVDLIDSSDLTGSFEWACLPALLGSLSPSVYQHFFAFGVEVRVVCQDLRTTHLT